MGKTFGEKVFKEKTKTSEKTGKREGKSKQKATKTSLAGRIKVYRYLHKSVMAGVSEGLRDYVLVYIHPHILVYDIDDSPGVDYLSV